MSYITDSINAKILLELSVEENHFSFDSNIDNALLSAEKEYLHLDEQISESFETIKNLLLNVISWTTFVMKVHMAKLFTRI